MINRLPHPISQPVHRRGKAGFFKTLKFETMQKQLYLGIGVTAEINGDELHIETWGGAGSDELNCVAVKGRGFYTGKKFTSKPYTFFWVSVYKSHCSENILVHWDGKNATQVVATLEQGDTVQFSNSGASLPLHAYAIRFESGVDYLESLTQLELQTVTIEAQVYTALHRVIGEKAPFWFQHWFVEHSVAANHKTIQDVLDWFWWAHFETGNHGLMFSPQGMPVPSETNCIEDQEMLDWLLQVEQDIDQDMLKLSHENGVGYYYAVRG